MYPIPDLHHHPQALISPSSVYTLPGHWHGVTEFCGYGKGREVMAGASETQEVLSDRVRLLAEACDSLQGEWESSATYHQQHAPPSQLEAPTMCPESSVSSAC
jgi:hypothetical protein